MHNPETTSQTAEQVRRTLAGDGAAFAELVRQHAGMVHVIALTRLDHDADAADELTQEVFLRAWLHLDKLSSAEMFAPWLARIARNLAADWRRRDRRNSGLVQMVPLDSAEHSAIPDASSDPHRTAARSEDAAQITAALKKLSGEQQELLLLHHSEGLSPADIARRLGIHRATVTRKLDRATQSLRAVYRTNAEAALKASRPGSSKATQRTLAVLAAATALPAAVRASLAEVAATSMAIPTTGAVSTWAMPAKRVAVAAGVAAAVWLVLVYTGALNGTQGNGLVAQENSSNPSRTTIRFMDEGVSALPDSSGPTRLAQSHPGRDPRLSPGLTGRGVGSGSTAVTTTSTQSNASTTGVATLTDKASPDTWVTGQVVDSNGHPMFNIKVEFNALTFNDDRMVTGPQAILSAVRYRHPILDRGRITTDAGGRFQIDLKSTGTALVYTDIEPYNRTVQKVEIPARDVQVVLTTAGEATAKGSVLRLDTGEPVPGAEVALQMQVLVEYSPGDSIATQTLPLSAGPLKTIADSSGTYRFDRMPPMPVDIMVWTETEPGLPPEMLEPDPPVLVAGTETILPDHFIFPGYTVRGYVRDIQTSAPVAGAVVGMMSGPPNAMGRGKMRAETDEQGYYELTGFPPVMESATEAARQKRSRGFHLNMVEVTKVGYTKAFHMPYLATFDPKSLVIDHDFELRPPSADPPTGPSSRDQRIGEHHDRVMELIRMNTERQQRR